MIDFTIFVLHAVVIRMFCFNCFTSVYVPLWICCLLIITSAAGAVNCEVL